MTNQGENRIRPSSHSWVPRAISTRIISVGVICVLVSTTYASQSPGQFFRLSDDIDEGGVPGAVIVVDPLTGQVTTVTDFDDFHEFTIPYPTFHEHQLPEPLAHFGQSQLQSLGPDSFENLLNNDATFAAWVHVPVGKALELVRRVGYAGQSTVGIASTAILGDPAASIFNEPTDALPEFFLYRSEFNPSNSVQPYRISIVGMPDRREENASASEWQHVAMFNWWQFGIWTTYDQDGAISPLFPSTATAFNQPLYTSGLSVITLESPFPFWTGSQVGGQVGDLAIYSGLVSPGLVDQLSAHSPLAAPEPSSALLLISAVSIFSAAVRRRNNAAGLSHC